MRKLKLELSQDHINIIEEYNSPQCSEFLEEYYVHDGIFEITNETEKSFMIKARMSKIVMNWKINKIRFRNEYIELDEDFNLPKELFEL